MCLARALRNADMTSDDDARDETSDVLPDFVLLHDAAHILSLIHI